MHHQPTWELSGRQLTQSSPCHTERQGSHCWGPSCKETCQVIVALLLICCIILKAFFSPSLCLHLPFYHA